MSQLINLNEVTPTKSNIDPVANALAAAVIDGSMSAAEFSVKGKFLVEAVTKAIKAVNETLISEVGSDRNFTWMGAKIEPAEVGTKYDYAADAKWCELQAKIEPLRELQKKQEELIQIATRLGKAIVDDDTGEIVAQPVQKTSTSSVKITLSK